MSLEFPISIGISLIALIISSIVLYQTHLKSFKLFFKLDDANLWIFSDETLRIDIHVILTNLGIKAGLVTGLKLYLYLTKQKKIDFIPELIYKFDKEEYVADDEWHSIFLGNKDSKFLVIGLRSKNLIEDLKKGVKYKAVLEIEYLKNLKKNIKETVEFSLKLHDIPETQLQAKKIKILDFNYLNKTKEK